MTDFFKLYFKDTGWSYVFQPHLAEADGWYVEPAGRGYICTRGEERVDVGVSNVPTWPIQTAC